MNEKPIKEKKHQSHGPNIYDVAEKAGVSIATVSRVLNNNSNVMEGTRHKVLDAIKALKFKPDVSARELGVRHNHLIQIFFHIAHYPIDFDNNWFGDILNGAGEVLQAHQYGVLINSISGMPTAEEIYHRVHHNRVDGILMIAPHMVERDLLRIMDQRVPIVPVEYRLENPHTSFVDTDNVNSVIQIVDHLVSLGHRKIACLAGPVPQNRNAQDRFWGFKKGLEKHGLGLPEDYVVTHDYYVREAGTEGMRELLSLPDRPTAVFGSNDQIALGAWDVAQSAGLKVGKDISIAGYDDIPVASKPPYSLTTVRQDFHKLSSTAAEILMDIIENPAGAMPRQILVPTQLIARQSTGKLVQPPLIPIKKIKRYRRKPSSRFHPVK
jgi:DNA-binding LacI/PurR family transcriptional regulator